VPHSEQNFAPGAAFAPHSLQKLTVIFDPHSGQNFALDLIFE